MSVLTLLSKAALLAGGSMAMGATLQGLTEAPAGREQPALVRTWGSVQLAGGAPVMETANKGSGDQAPSFRMEALRVVSIGADDEGDRGFRVGPWRAVPVGAGEESGPAVEPVAAPRVTPSPEEITSAMHELRPAIQRCYDTGMVPGQVELTLTVSGKTGRVIESSVSEESTTARCLRRLSEGVRFAPFERERVTVRWPFSFR